jgi:threonine dehydrogenase-like Zn-dependent dehydrogenase
MRATIIHGAGDIRVDTVPDPKIQQPTDALVRVVSACICGSDLWPYGSMDASHEGERIGHEFVGVIEDLGDGAVGLSAVLAAKRLGAERIILMGRHKDRTDLGVEFGATDVVAERGAEGIERVRELTGGDGTHAVLECVGLKEAIETSFGVVRDGGTVSRVGAPQYDEVPMTFGEFMANVTLTGGVAPARAYINELLPDILEGRIQPGKVFDLTLGLDDIADGYRAMADRRALKVLARP